MGFFLAPILTVWLFNRKPFFFSSALTIVMLFDIFSLRISSYNLMFYQLFFVIISIYCYRNAFRLSSRVNKDFIYLISFLSLPPLTYIIIGGSFGFLIYVIYFSVLSVLMAFVIDKRYNKLELLRSFSLVCTSIVLLYTAAELYWWPTHVRVFSSVYDLDGIRQFGGMYGRSLGPSREPSHLILVQIVTLIIGFRCHQKLPLFYILTSWFFISQFTYSRSIFLILVIAITIGFWVRSRGMMKIASLLLVGVTFSLILLMGDLSERFTSGFSLLTDISTLQRYGTHFIILFEYFSRYSMPITLLSSDLMVCNSDSTNLVNLICNFYVPALGFSSYYLASLPLLGFLIPIFHRRISYLVIPILIAGLCYWVTITPAVLSITLLWVLKKHHALQR